MAVGRVASILAGVVLARILVPEDYGVFAPALALVTILFGLNDLGLLLALVRWKGDLREAARTAQTITMAFSALLYVGCFVAAPWFAETMDSPQSAPVLRLLALTVFIDGITTVAHGLLVRDFRQDRFAKAEFAAIPVQIATAVVLAAAGAGVWALAISQVLANCVSGALLLRAAPFRVGLGFRFDIARPMLAYGLPLALTSLVEYSLLNADYLIISRALDPAAVGIYLLAFNVSTWPLSIITDAVRRVSIAGFAKLDGDSSSLRRNFSPALAALMTVAFPFLVALGVLALPLITILYGDQWQESASILPYLVVLTGARMAIGFIFDLLVGVGRTRTTLALKCAWLAAVLIALEIGVQADGLRGAAIGHGIVATIWAMPLFLVAATRAGADIPDVGRRLVRPVAGAVAATVAGLFVRDWIDGTLASLLAGGVAVVGAYSLVALRRKDLAVAEQRLRQWRARRLAAAEV